MNDIQKELISDGDSYPCGYSYKMKASKDYADVEIKVEAEIGGHGCLYSIEIPKISINGGCFGGSKENPEKNDVLHVLNQILKDYNCRERIIIRGCKEI